MHSIALLVNFASCYQVRAQGLRFGEVGSEVHLLPLKPLLELVAPREPKLPQVPPLDEVYLAVWMWEEKGLNQP